MRQQIANRNLFRGWNRVSLPRRRLHQHFRILEFRNVLRHRIVQQEVPFFVEHHHRQAGDRLGHGADAENGIGLHRLGRLAVRHALCPKPNNLPPPRNQRHRARNSLVRDAAIHRGGDPLQPFRRQPHRLRLRCGKFLAKHRHAGGEYVDRQRASRKQPPRMTRCRKVSREIWFHGVSGTKYITFRPLELRAPDSRRNWSSVPTAQTSLEQRAFPCWCSRWGRCDSETPQRSPAPAIAYLG